MGAGKSTIGRLLAKHLSLPFIDTDSLIEKKLGMPITKVFKKKGESFFRSEEQKLLQNISRQSPQVVSLGGGIILNPVNRDILKKGVWINLKLAPAVIFERVKDQENRPLLGKKPKQETIEDILKQRQLFYNSASHQIETTGLSPEGVVEEILKIVHREMTW